MTRTEVIDELFEQLTLEDESSSRTLHETVLCIYLGGFRIWKDLCVKTGILPVKQRLGRKYGMLEGKS